ncbi:MAG TPA: glycosyltransferase, partial [Reyranella sp.]|nr:glycosyltransferase [Reyranella sp.]
MTHARPALSVVAPCFNEEGVLPEFVRRVAAVLDGIDATAEIVLVDDGSRDGTWKAMTEAAARDQR